MTFESWYLVVGALLIVMALMPSVMKRLPLTATILYLAVGLLLGPIGFQLFTIDPLKESKVLVRLAEIAVIVSLFTAGLKLRLPLGDPLWRVPMRLAFLSMTITVGVIAASGVWLLGLPLGAAVILGGILAPTDPVLASDVQLEHAHDRDRLRFGLTGEAGLNDGTAFPFVMLGLGLLGLHDIGTWGWRWVLVDVLWATVAGLGIGAGLGTLTAKLVLYLRRVRKEAVGRDEFLVLGLIALTYGTAVLLHSYGFLAVFGAGLAVRAIERQNTGDRPPKDVLAAGATPEKQQEIATHPEKAPAHMAEAVLAFNEQIERILEVALVLVVAGIITAAQWHSTPFWFIVLLFLGIRPMAVYVGLTGSEVGRAQRKLMAWFGIRGIGSIYYLMYAIERGVPQDIASQLVALTMSAIAVSVVVHGISVTPLMTWYEKRSGRGRSGSQTK